MAKRKQPSLVDKDSIQVLPDMAAKVVKTYRKNVSQLQGKTLFDAKEKQELLDRLREKALDDLNDLESMGMTAMDEIRGVGKVSDADEVPAAALLAEMQATRAWNRTKDLLDAGLQNPSNDFAPNIVIQETLDQATNAKNEALLSVLREELPVYLKVNKMPEYLPVLDKFFDNAGGPDEKARRNQLAPFEQGWARTQSAFAFAKNAIEHSLSPRKSGGVPITDAYSIPAWADGELIDIDGVASTTEETTATGERINTRTVPGVAAD